MRRAWNTGIVLVFSICLNHNNTPPPKKNLGKPIPVDWATWWECCISLTVTLVSRLTPRLPRWKGRDGLAAGLAPNHSLTPFPEVLSHLLLFCSGGRPGNYTLTFFNTCCASFPFSQMVRLRLQSFSHSVIVSLVCGLGQKVSPSLDRHDDILPRSLSEKGMEGSGLSCFYPCNFFANIMFCF